MFLKLICSTLFVALVSGNGEFIVLHHPKSLVFKGHEHVKESILKEVYSSALGFSTQQYSNWNGLFIEDPFNLAKAVVTVAVDGVPSIGYSKGHHFPLKTNDAEYDVYTSLERRVKERYPESENNLVRINLDEGLEELNKIKLFERIKNDKPEKQLLNQLKLSVDEDRAFLSDITLLNSIVDEVAKSGVEVDNAPDVYWFKIESLHPLVDLYGENSTQVKEAKQLLNEAILKLNSVFNKLYNGNVLVSVIASDAIHTRRSRSILAADEPTVPDVNPAKVYDKNYPVIFNIILWFGVAMLFTLLAVCISLASMDPGRDSIIYRMTNTRLKKDN